MLLQISIALTIKNVTILTKIKVRWSIDRSTLWLSQLIFPLLKAKARMRFVLFIFFSVFEYEINTPPRVL